MEIFASQNYVTKEIFDWFQKRTNKHISLVQKYCSLVYELDQEKYKDLIDRSLVHDESKFNEPELVPYIWITWQYRCKDLGLKFVGPKNIKELMNEATQHHVLNNAHHPESHQKHKSKLINRENRDLPPEEIVDGTKMSDVDIAEMVSDWCAVSEEKDNDPKDWADKNVNIRWKFTDEQKELIYSLISEIWS